MSTEEKIRTPISGPSVTWNRDDVKSMLLTFGYERAVKMIMADVFQEDYVKRMILEVKHSEDYFTRTQSFASTGIL